MRAEDYEPLDVALHLLYRVRVGDYSLESAQCAGWQSHRHAVEVTNAADLFDEFLARHLGV